MIEALLVSGDGGPVVPEIRGEIQWNTAGTYQWVCPEDVHTVAVMLVGGGESGRQGYGASGISGNASFVRWKNDVAVVPGQVYTIIVGSGGVNWSGLYSDSIASSGKGPSSAFGITAATAGSTPVGSGVFGYNGGSGAIKTTLGGRVFGASSGGIAGHGAGGTEASAPLGVNLKGGYVGGTPGLGWGGSATNPSAATGSSPKSITKGAEGGVRIIWGRDRAFPTKDVGDTG